MKFVNKKTGLVGEVIKYNDNAKTYHLRFEDGSTTLVSPITLGRDYKELYGDSDKLRAIGREIGKQKNI